MAVKVSALVAVMVVVVIVSQVTSVRSEEEFGAKIRVDDDLAEDKGHEGPQGGHEEGLQKRRRGVRDFKVRRSDDGGYEERQIKVDLAGESKIQGSQNLRQIRRRLNRRRYSSVLGLRRRHPVPSRGQNKASISRASHQEERWCAKHRSRTTHVGESAGTHPEAREPISDYENTRSVQRDEEKQAWEKTDDLAYQSGPSTELPATPSLHLDGTEGDAEHLQEPQGDSVSPHNHPQRESTSDSRQKFERNAFPSVSVTPSSTTRASPQDVSAFSSVLPAPLTTSRATVHDPATAAAPGAAPTPTPAPEKVAENTEIRIDTSVFQTTPEPLSSHRLLNAPTQTTIGLTLPSEDTDEGKRKSYKPFTLPFAPSRESWPVNKGTKATTSQVQLLTESNSIAAKQSVRENGSEWSNQRWTQADRGTHYYWEYIQDRKGSERVYRNYSQLEESLPHQILASTQDIIGKASMTSKRETKVEESPSSRHPVERTDSRPGSSFSFVSFQRFPTAFRSNPGLENEREREGTAHLTDSFTLSQQRTPSEAIPGPSRTTKSIQESEDPFRTTFPVRRTTPGTSRRTTGIQAAEHPSKITTSPLRTTPGISSRSSRTQIKVPRPSSRPTSRTTISHVQVEGSNEDEKQDEGRRGRPVLPLESILEGRGGGEEEGRGRKEEEDEGRGSFFPSFRDFLRDHGVSDLPKSPRHSTKDEDEDEHEDEDENKGVIEEQINMEILKQGPTGVSNDLHHRQVNTGAQVRGNKKHLSRPNQRPRFPANHRQRLRTPTNQELPPHVSANQRPVRPFPTNPEPPRPFLANHGPPRHVSANQRPPSPHLTNHEQPHPFSANQGPPQHNQANQQQESFRHHNGPINEHSQKRHVTPSDVTTNHDHQFHPSPKPSDVIDENGLPVLKDFPTSTTPLPPLTSLSLPPFPPFTSFPSSPLSPPPSVGQFFFPTPRLPFTHTSLTSSLFPPLPPLPPHHQGGKEGPSSTSTFTIGSSPSGSFSSSAGGRPELQGPRGSFKHPRGPHLQEASQETKFRNEGNFAGPRPGGHSKNPQPHNQQFSGPHGPSTPQHGPGTPLAGLPEGLNFVDSFPHSPDPPYSVVKLEPQLVFNFPSQGHHDDFQSRPLPHESLRLHLGRQRGKRLQGSRGPLRGTQRPGHHAHAPERMPRIKFSGGPDTRVKPPSVEVLRNTRDSPPHLQGPPGDFHDPQFIHFRPPRPQGHGNTISGGVIRVKTRKKEFGPTGHGNPGEVHHGFGGFHQGQETHSHRPTGHGGGHSSSPPLQPHPLPLPQFSHISHHNPPAPHTTAPSPQFHPLPLPPPPHNSPTPPHHPQPHLNNLETSEPHIRTFSRPSEHALPEPHETPSTRGHHKGFKPMKETSQPLSGALELRVSESHARLLKNMEYGVHGEPLDVWIPIVNKRTGEEQGG